MVRAPPASWSAPVPGNGHAWRFLNHQDTSATVGQNPILYSFHLGWHWASTRHSVLWHHHRLKFHCKPEGQHAPTLSAEKEDREIAEMSYFASVWNMNNLTILLYVNSLVDWSNCFPVLVILVSQEGKTSGNPIIYCLPTTSATV